MARRPLVFVLVLTVGDYLVWNWSLNGNHDVIALVSGLTLPPLALASISLLGLAVARLLGGLARRSPADANATVAMRQVRRSRGYETAPAAGQTAGKDAPAARAAQAQGGSRKIAA